MLLTTLLKHFHLPLQGQGISVTGMTCHSNKIQKGDIFVVLKGAHRNGADFIPDALKRGAVALLTDQKLPPQKVPVIYVNDAHLMWAKMAAYLFKIKDLKVLAVTGTNGKTSTVYFIEQILNKLKIAAASIGTIGVKSPVYNMPGHLTLPEPDTLYQTLHILEKKKIQVVALEASSQGLDQERLSGLQTVASGFTNLTQDHLDYHASFQAYLDCKMRLFTERTQTGGTAVLNADIPEFDYQKQVCRQAGLKVISYGFNGKDLHLLSAENKGDYQKILIQIGGKKHTVKLPVVGDFQVHNGLCALGLCHALGISYQKILPLLDHIQAPMGRMELIGHLPNQASVYVDYAHTPDALEHVLKSLRAKHPAGLVALFGARGNRDQTKRPIMGEIAHRLADKVYITDDDTDTEDPADIRAMILKNCPKAKEIPNRSKAIETAINGLTSKEILVIMGKGHENYQLTKQGIHTYSDIVYVRQLIKKMKGTLV